MMSKIFSYGTLWDKDLQIKEFGTHFHVEDDLDYMKGWGIIDIKIYNRKHRIAIPNEESVISGAIIHVPDTHLEIIDKYEGKHYKRIKIKTLTDVDCFMYVRNDAK